MGARYPVSATFVTLHVTLHVQVECNSKQLYLRDADEGGDLSGWFAALKDAKPMAL